MPKSTIDYLNVINADFLSELITTLANDLTVDMNQLLYKYDCLF